MTGSDAASFHVKQVVRGSDYFTESDWMLPRIYVIVHKASYQSRFFELGDSQSKQECNLNTSMIILAKLS
jgi:hypothetical protein